MGLLSKTISLANSNKIDFKQFTKKYNISLCAVFSKINNDYIITDSIGFDGISIISSISTSDFWEGTIKNKIDWLFYKTNEEMLPFYQLFSFNQKDKITGIVIKRLEDKILMVCSTNSFIFEPTPELSQDLLNISFLYNNKINIENITKQKDEEIYKFELDFSSAVNFHIQKNLRNTEYAGTVYDSISKEIVSFLEKSFPKPNIVSKISNSKIHIGNISNISIPFNLLQNHLIGELYSILDEESKLISFTNQGKSNSYKDLVDFLQAQ